MILNIVPTDLLAHQLQRLATVRSELPAIMEDEVVAAGSELAAELGSAAPRSGSTGSAIEGDTSGPLAESFTSDVEGSDGVVALRVKTTQPTKLKFVRFGTGIHGPRGERIYPKVKRALHWDDRFARSVAGQEANDFASPLTDEAGSVINDRVAGAIGEALQLLVS